MQILVVDDDPVSLTVLTLAVKRLGHEPVCASDGTEALELYRTLRPRIVISDWCMPIMSGVELCRNIRAEADIEQPYFMLVTTLSAREDTLEGFRAGTDDYLAKPVDAEILASRMRVAERAVSALGVKSERALRQIVETCQSVVGHEHPALLESLHALSEIYVEQNAFAKARAFLRRQLAIAEKNGDESTVAKMKKSLADVNAREEASAIAEPRVARG